MTIGAVRSNVAPSATFVILPPFSSFSTSLCISLSLRFNTPSLFHRYPSPPVPRSSSLFLPICLLSTLLRGGILLARIVSAHCLTVARSFVLLGPTATHCFSSLLRLLPSVFSFSSYLTSTVNFARRLPSRAFLLSGIKWFPDARPFLDSYHCFSNRSNERPGITLGLPSA